MKIEINVPGIATSPLDEPRIYLPYSYYNPNRTKVAEWVVGVHNDPEGRTERTETNAVMKVTHHGKRDWGNGHDKCFVADLHRTFTEHRIGMDGKPYQSTTRTFSVGYRSSLDFLVRPVARYSEKVRNEVFAEALEWLRNNLDHPEVVMFFDPTATEIN